MSILLLNIMLVDFELLGANDLLLSYDVGQWNTLISCLSKSSFAQQSVDLTEFVLKVLVQSAVDGLQALEFPYPDPKSNNSRVQSKITGIKHDLKSFLSLKYLF